MVKTESKIRMARGMRFGYVKIPAEVEMIPEAILGSRGKRLCGHIGSFGVMGCYQSKATLGRYFGVSRRTIIRLVKRLKMLQLIVWVDTNGVPGCMWLRCLPKVQQVEWLSYRGLSVRNPACTCDKFVTGGVSPMSQVPGAPVSQDYNMTNKPTSDASPSPAERQAQHRREEEANRRTLIQSQLRAKAVERLPRADFVSSEMMKWRHEKILQVMNQGLELVLGGMSVDDAVEAVFNETECAVSEKGA